MLKTLWNGRSGLQANQNRIDAISNNIANLNTAGYKRIDVAFQDVFYEKMDRLGLPATAQNRENLTQGSGSRADKLVKNNLQGTLSETGKNTDFAISGSGFFKVVGENGEEYYTRDGSFKMDSDGNLVHSSGMKLEIINFNVDAISDSFSINNRGELVSDKGIIGSIALYDFQDKDNMLSVGQGLFTGTTNSQVPSGEIKQGYIEQSNVDIAKELTDMMITQRAYELNSRSISAADQMWQIANNIRSK